MVPESYTLYVNEKLFVLTDVEDLRHGFFASLKELHGLHGTHPLPNETSGRLDDTEICEKSVSSNQPKATETPNNENP